MAIGLRYPLRDLDAAMDAVLARVRADADGIGPGLSLAVDAGNAPALKLYFRHGLRRVGARLALIRDLRSLPDSAEPPAAL